MLTPPHEIRRALNCLVPLVKQYWERPVQAYSSALYDGFELSDAEVRRDAFIKLCKLLRDRAIRSGHNETEVQKLIGIIRRRPVIQTGPHCHLIIEPDAFYTHLFALMGLNAHSEGWYINYSVSTVKFTEKSKKGPGWLWLDGQHVNVFGLSRRRMEPYSICGRYVPCHFALKPTDDQISHPALDLLRAVLLVQEFSSAAEAIKSANHDLWRHCFGETIKSLQLDDADVALLIIDHLRDRNSWLSRYFIDAPDMVSLLLQSVRELNDGPWDGWFKFNTDFFWFMSEGRLRPLRLEGNTLSDATGSFKMGFNSSSLANSLEAGEIVPGLFLVFLVIAILPGLRAMGGSRQVVYYPLMRHALLRALDRSSALINKELAKDIRSDHMTNVWGHRTIAPICADPWRLFIAKDPATFASLSQSFATQTLMETSGGLPGFVNDELWSQCAGEDFHERLKGSGEMIASANREPGHWQNKR